MSTSNLTTVLVAIDRKAAIRSGYNGTDSPASISVDVSTLSQDDRDEFASRLDFASQSDEQYRGMKRGSAYLRGHSSSGSREGILTLSRPTLEGLLEAFADYRSIPARLAAEKQARVDAAIAAAHEKLAAEPQIIRRECTLSLRRDGTIDHHNHGVRLAHITYHYDAEVLSGYTAPDTPAELVNLVMAREAMYKERTEAAAELARDRAHLQLLADHWQPRLNWVAQHGSRDLNRMVSENIDWADVYDEERAKWEDALDSGAMLESCPGWIVLDEPEKLGPPKRPRARAWAILDAARQTVPTAKLGMLGSKYVAYAQYLGKTIIWPAD